MKTVEAKVTLTPYGIPEGASVVRSEKQYKDVRNLYENPREDNPIVYEVYTYTEGEESKLGNLNWGLTVMHPVYSNGECNMTKGHFHSNRDCAEFYFCTQGEGLLLLMDEEGNTWAEVMKPGSLHHIDGHVAHRCVNTGDTDLYIGACWPSASGHDYAAIDEREFGFRVKKVDGELVFERRDS